MCQDEVCICVCKFGGMESSELQPTLAPSNLPNMYILHPGTGKGWRELEGINVSTREERSKEGVVDKGHYANNHSEWCRALVQWLLLELCFILYLLNKLTPAALGALTFGEPFQAIGALMTGSIKKTDGLNFPSVPQLLIFMRWRVSNACPDPPPTHTNLYWSSVSTCFVNGLVASVCHNQLTSQAVIVCVTLFRILLAWELPPYHLVVLLGLLMLL